MQKLQSTATLDILTMLAEYQYQWFLLKINTLEYQINSKSNKQGRVGGQKVKPQIQQINNQGFKQRFWEPIFDFFFKK